MDNYMCSGTHWSPMIGPINVLRDPLDQYSDWPCNKCDFSLEVTSNPVYVCLFPSLRKHHNHQAEGGLKPKSEVEKISGSILCLPFILTLLHTKVPDLERKIDQMEEELNDLSAK